MKTEASWVGTWASGQQLTEADNEPPAPGLSHNTLRQVVFATLGGSRLRLRLSNEFGDGPATLNAVRVALSTNGSSIDPASDTALGFEGSPSVTIPKGESVCSDPFEFSLSPLTKVAITIAFGSTPAGITGHPGSRTTSYLVTGNRASAPNLSGAVSTEHWYYLSALEVLADASARAVVTLGDSITDGRGSTTDGNDRWPDQLARRLRNNPATELVSVVNQGIGGNAVVTGGLGPTARARFDRDVLGVPGVKFVIVFEGVNDIGNGEKVAGALISVYREFIDKAHARGILAYGATLTPFGGSIYDSPAHESDRLVVNDWLRTSGEFDAVLELDAALRDPSDTSRLRSAYDCGDGLHLSPAGYRKLADAIDLALFTRPFARGAERTDSLVRPG